MSARVSTSRRGYALALTMIILIIVGIMTAVMLERQGTQALAVKRQLDQYQEHHGKKGLAEVIEAYLLMLQNVDIGGLIEEDPHLFDLVLGDGSIVSVSFSRAQGRALASTRRLSAGTREKAELVLKNLRSSVEPGAYDRLTRPDGPAAIDAQSADETVLMAAVQAAMRDEDLGKRVAQQLIDMRSQRGLTRADIGRVATELDLTVEQRGDLSELLTVQPTIWGVRVELRTPRFGNKPERVVSAYEGMVRMSASRNQRAGRGNLFLSFEPVDLAEQSSGDHP